MDVAGTSRLSADLKFGTISPRAVWTAVRASKANERAPHSTRAFSNLSLRSLVAAWLWSRRNDYLTIACETLRF